MSRDNWTRLVSAVVKKQEIWEMFHQHSRSPSLSSLSSSDITSSFSDFEHDVSMHTSSQPPLAASSTSSGDNDCIAQFKRFSLHQLEVATDNFSQNNLVSPNEYYEVYKGQLENGSRVAVRKMPTHKIPIGNMKLRLQKEMEIMSVAVHPNLISLVGFCITKNELLLVYPLMVNGSVASRISDTPLNWVMRKKIALGSAKGLLYLHEMCNPRICHGNLEASNVLLNEEFEAVLCDFECSIMFTRSSNTDIRTAISKAVGTYEHPTYYYKGEFSDKRDVHGYGSFLLELINARRAFNLDRLARDQYLMFPEWVVRCAEGGEWERFFDPNAPPSNDHEREVGMQLVKLALLCMELLPERRPKMSEAVSMLEDDGSLLESANSCVHVSTLF